MRSSIVGVRCFSPLIALFASRMSTQIRTSPDFSGTTTMGTECGTIDFFDDIQSFYPLEVLLNIFSNMERNSAMTLLSGYDVRFDM